MDLLKRREYSWKLVYEPDFGAARKRRDKGQEVLDDPDSFIPFLPEDWTIEDEEDIEVPARNADLYKALRRGPRS